MRRLCFCLTDVALLGCSGRGIPYTLTSEGGCVEVVMDPALVEQLGSSQHGTASASASAAPPPPVASAPPPAGGSNRFEDIKRGGLQF
jgi:hypothetical protein